VRKGLFRRLGWGILTQGLCAWHVAAVSKGADYMSTARRYMKRGNIKGWKVVKDALLSCPQAPQLRKELSDPR
jgi:hypothetical protein